MSEGAGGGRRPLLYPAAANQQTVSGIPMRWKTAGPDASRDGLRLSLSSGEREKRWPSLCDRGPPVFHGVRSPDACEFSRMIPLRGGFHLFQHFLQGNIRPPMALTLAVGDPGVDRRTLLRQELVQDMDGVVEKIIIRFAGSDMQLAPELGLKPGPIFFEHEPQVIFFPMLSDGMINEARVGIPDRPRQAIQTASAVHCIPSAPLLARQGVTVPPTQQVFDLSLPPHGQHYVSSEVARAGPFECVRI